MRKCSTTGRMEEYVALCDSLSTSRFLVIPGLEFSFKGGVIHILGYGIIRRVRAPSMEELVDGRTRCRRHRCPGSSTGRQYQPYRRDQDEARRC
jgi:hypothetical protein